jgi:phosphate-selective porin OprO/OprP
MIVLSPFAAGEGADPGTFGRLGSKESYDRLWRHVALYENEENRVLQKLVCTGRFQYDYALVDGQGWPSKGVYDDDLDYYDWNTRRLRLGFKATLFEVITAHVEADFDPDVDSMYQRLTDAYLAWAPRENFKLTLGKHGMPFTLDGATSSKELLTIDRSNVANNLWFPSEYLPGLSTDFTAGPWSFKAGGYSAGEADGEFGDFGGGWAWLASAGCDLAKRLSAEVAELRVDYVYQDDDPLNDWTRMLRNTGSLVFQWEDGGWGFRGDLTAGDGYLGQSDLWGLQLMPYYSFNGFLQLVLRVTYLESDRADGVRFARYESFPTDGRRGDEYREVYLGLNWYLYGHKLKLQTGVQYLAMDDRANNGGEFDGWAWTTGLRIAW